MIHLDTIDTAVVAEVKAWQYDSGIHVVMVSCHSTPLAMEYDWRWTSYDNICTFSLYKLGEEPALQFTVPKTINRCRTYFARDKRDWCVTFVPVELYENPKDIELP